MSPSGGDAKGLTEDIKAAMISKADKSDVETLGITKANKCDIELSFKWTEHIHQ